MTDASQAMIPDQGQPTSPQNQVPISNPGAFQVPNSYQQPVTQTPQPTQVAQPLQPSQPSAQMPSSSPIGDEQPDARSQDSEYEDEMYYDEEDIEPNQEQYYQQDSRPQSEQLLLEWQAASRPFKKRNRQYYTTIAAIVILISLILFFAGQFLPIAVVIAVAFLAYVLSAVPPETVTYRVTTYGIRIGQNLYYWEELGRFWYTQKYNQRLLHLELARFPNQLTLVLGSQDEAELTELLSELLLQEQPLPTTFDKVAAWLQEKIPLDTES